LPDIGKEWMKSKCIVVLLGGESPEREVSLDSGSAIMRELQRQGHQVMSLDPAEYASGSSLLQAIRECQPDVVFNGLHGGAGEDGTMQAMLNYEGIPNTGSGFRASAVAMDKYLSKLIARQAAVPVPRFLLLEKAEAESIMSMDKGFAAVSGMLKPESGKLVLKPVDSGSSMGVYMVESSKQWKSALHALLRITERIIIEEFISGRELTVAILDDAALPVVEIIPKQGFYDYQNKYTKGCTEYVAPAPLTKKESNKIKGYALDIWLLMQCAGYGRVDFRYNGKKFYFLEVNTLPGMTALSLTPMAAQAAGIGFGALLTKIIEIAEASKQTKI